MIETTNLPTNRSSHNTFDRFYELLDDSFGLTVFALKFNLETLKNMGLIPSKFLEQYRKSALVDGFNSTVFQKENNDIILVFYKPEVYKTLIYEIAGTLIDKDCGKDILYTVFS